MPTRPCPSCNEIIPSDVDYCPFCGNSTRESLTTGDDAVRNTRVLSMPLDAKKDIRKQAQKLPPEAGETLCAMCYVQPATVGEYCVACDRKLNMKPEEWDAINSQAAQARMMIFGAIAVVVLLMVIIVAAVKHGHRVMSPHPAPIAATAPASASTRPAPTAATKPATAQGAPTTTTPAAPARSPITVGRPATAVPGAQAPATVAQPTTTVQGATQPTAPGAEAPPGGLPSRT